MIANLDPWGTPVIADMDTGYGGTSNLFTVLSFLPAENHQARIP